MERKTFPAVIHSIDTCCSRALIVHHIAQHCVCIFGPAVLRPYSCRYTSFSARLIHPEIPHSHRNTSSYCLQDSSCNKSRYFQFPIAECRSHKRNCLSVKLLARLSYGRFSQSEVTICSMVTAPPLALTRKANSSFRFSVRKEQRFSVHIHIKITKGSHIYLPLFFVKTKSLYQSLAAVDRIFQFRKEYGFIRYAIA